MDVDCGGSCPNRCAEGATCLGNGDCATGICDNGACAQPRCGDGLCLAMSSVTTEIAPIRMRVQTTVLTLIAAMVSSLDIAEGEPGFESCDDGNDVNDDTCRNDCVLPSCGDGVTQPGEGCDDGECS